MDFNHLTRWLGLISGILTLILGIIHLAKKSASIHWPSNSSFLDDINFIYWREVFTFRPDKAISVWTPTVFGLLAIGMHTSNFKVHFCTQSFLTYAMFNFVKGLFAELGYRGGLGIIFSSITWLVCLMSLISWWRQDESVSLELDTKCSLRSK